MAKTTQGKRVPDNTFPVNAGEYSKITKEVKGMWWPGKPYWMVRSPQNSAGNLVNHIVRENDDRTITVMPEPNCSNSILIIQGEKRWHGFIEKGVWREC